MGWQAGLSLARWEQVGASLALPWPISATQTPPCHADEP